MLGDLVSEQRTCLSSAMPGAALLILSGLPGAGKTTIVRELARRIGAVHVRIDSIEHAIMNPVW